MVDQTMLMMLCAEERVEELIQVLDAHPDVTGFTELQNLQGSGSTGRHLGTRAYPGTVSMLLTVGDDRAMAALADDLKEFSKGCRPGTGLRVFALKASQML
ncbi:MAG: hypothetical protein PVG07_05765 [Acidobacteriota bacterium]|jgi:hypothetical protein